MHLRIDPLIASLAVVGSLMGCVGVPMDELRSTPPFLEGRSALSIDAFTRCLLDLRKIDGLRTDGSVLVTTLPASGVEITIGTAQLGGRRNYYLLRMSAVGNSTVVIASRAPSN